MQLISRLYLVISLYVKDRPDALNLIYPLMFTLFSAYNEIKNVEQDNLYILCRIIKFEPLSQNFLIIY